MSFNYWFGGQSVSVAPQPSNTSTIKYWFGGQAFVLLPNGGTGIEARSTIQVKLKGTPTVTAALQGRATIQVKAKPNLRGDVAIAGRNTVAVKLKGVFGSGRALFGLISAQVKLKSASTATVELKTLTTVQVKGRLGAPGSGIPLFGRIATAVKARGALHFGPVTLAGRISVKTWLRDLLLYPCDLVVFASITIDNPVAAAISVGDMPVIGCLTVDVPGDVPVIGLLSGLDVVTQAVMCCD